MNRVISKYNKQWTIWFQDISEYLKKYLKTYVAIEHIGSTSIPDMDAKPIIDIDIEISSEADFNAVRKELEAIGYNYQGDLGIKGREVFKRSGKRKSILDRIEHHLYVCASNSEEYNRHIKFRDRLRSDKFLREEYKAIKYEILEKVGPENRAGYVEMKENDYRDFFGKVLS